MIRLSRSTSEGGFKVRTCPAPSIADFVYEFVNVLTVLCPHPGLHGRVDAKDVAHRVADEA